MMKKIFALLLALVMALALVACGQKEDNTVSYTHLTLPTIA